MTKQIVVDSGIVVKWIVDEPDSETANGILDEFGKGKIEFVAPDLIFAEIGNILWKKSMFQGFAFSDVRDAVEILNGIPIQPISTSILFDSTISIAVDHKRTFYDSLYLAASDHFGCDFITADERLYNSVKTSFPRIALLSTWQDEIQTS